MPALSPILRAYEAGGVAGIPGNSNASARANVITALFIASHFRSDRR